MRITFNGTDHVSHIGKRLSKRFNVPYTKGLEFASRLFGYESWADLKDLAGDPPRFWLSMPSIPDSRCMPLAVSLRRDYQARTLAKMLPISLDEAERAIDEIKPSDHFQLLALPWNTEKEEQNDRRVNPICSFETYEAAQNVLLEIGPHVTHRHAVYRKFDDLWNACEISYLTEYPINQFGDSVLFRCSASGDNHPRWLDAGKLQALKNKLSRLRSLFSPLINQAALAAPKQIERCLTALECALDTWREQSVPHDQEPVSWLGRHPAHIAGLEWIRSNIAKPWPHELRFAYDLSFTSSVAEWLLEEIPNLPQITQETPEGRRVKAAAKRSITINRKYQAAESLRTSSRFAEWVICHVDEAKVTPLGRVVAQDSLSAIAACPPVSSGRLIASSLVLANSLAGLTSDEFNRLPNLLEEQLQ
ncbi:MAG: hypothetical protein FD131_3281 [Rhodocyclaceae bacterium]|nr:MAG: hypothetical protein FD131_3281 [Rhodocyclaceae bacterium]